MGRWNDLAQAARSSGLQVIEVAGWTGRGKPTVSGPGGIDCHHTATSDKAKGDMPSLALLVGGRSDLPGPLCNLGLSRTGVVYVVASGKANHAGKTDTTDSSNTRAIGIEAENDGVGPWTGEQYAAYAKLCAALAKWYRLPVTAVRGHKEIAVPRGRKTDPNFDMASFRTAVTAAMMTPGRDALTDTQAAALLGLLGGDTKRFQSANGLTPDGDVGPLTKAKLAVANLGLTATPPALAAVGAIGQSTVLRPGQHVASRDGKTTLNMQTDGNLVVYRDGKAVWQCGTRGNHTAMQADGNLVLYAAGTPMWSSHTDHNPGAQLTVQTDGNVVIYDVHGKALWHTGTQRTK